MSDSRWQRVRQLFEHALELGQSERSQFLDASCENDAGLRREVEELLAADTDTTHSDRLEAGAAAFLPTPEPSPVGQRVGAYTIDSVLGAGGMGTVFLAEQDEPRRTVALKMLNSGLFSEAARRRFRYEADVLARLNHPAIAQIYEIGTWESGGQVVPFFAMEHIHDARRLDEWAEGQDQKAILEQFLRICDAVHYAHQRGVIHRDLKPSNILVDGQGFAKVIDFGIARSTDVHSPEQTKAGQILGTLAYMAPEQLAEAHGDGVDIRADVHALGAILFELLTGRPPIDVRDTPLPVAARRIAEEQIPVPSSFVSLAPELDWIVMKAVAKNRDERYASVAGLALDLQRFLRNEPVLVGPPSALYRTKKFMQRHRVWVAAGVLAVASLVAGAVMLTIGLVEARDSEKEAKTAQKEAEGAQQKAERELAAQASVTNWLHDMLAAPRTKREGRHVLLVDVLDAASGKLDALRRAKPEVAALLHEVVGLSYQSVGRSDKAEELLESALDLAEVHLGKDHRMTQGCRNNLAVVYNANGKLEEAMKLHTEVLAWRIGNFGEDHEQTAQSQNNVAAVLLTMQRPKLALPLLDAARETFLRVFGSTHRLTIINQNSRAGALRALGRLAEAEAALRNTLEHVVDHWGEEHETTMVARGSLAQVLMMRGQLAEAEKIWRALVKTEEHRRGPGHSRTLDAISNLAIVLMRQDRYDDAEPFVRRTMQNKRGMRYLIALNSLGVIQYKQDKFGESSKTFALLFESVKGRLSKDHWLIGQFHVCYGDSLVANQKFAAAEKELSRGLQLLESGLTAEHARTQQALRSMVRLYVALDRKDDAARYRARLGKKN